jgi:hypothetical protein
LQDPGDVGADEAQEVEIVVELPHEDLLVDLVDQPAIFVIHEGGVEVLKEEARVLPGQVKGEGLLDYEGEGVANLHCLLLAVVGLPVEAGINVV